jgi:cbb3-type cytochrome oxidase maturation protein
MGVIVVLVVASLIIALGFLGAFIWSVKKGQFEDDYTPSVRMLFENEVEQENNKQNRLWNCKNLITTTKL